MIGLAAAYPTLGKSGGTLKAEITVNYVVIALIFFISGLSLKSTALLDSILYIRLIALVQLFSLVLVPTLGYFLSKLLLLVNFDENLANGLVVAMCIPTTISSNVLMTKAADGNEAAALTNAVLGSIIGIFVSPALIYWFLNLAAAANPIDYSSVFAKLAMTIIGPLVVGQIIRLVFPATISYLQSVVNFSIINSCLLLALIYEVFCDTFSSNSFQKVSTGSFIAVIFLVMAIFLFLSWISFLISRIPYFNFSRPDTVAIIMCSATKSAALGIPIIKVVFSDNPNIGIITLPLLLFHAEQLIGGSFMVPWLKSWVGFAVKSSNNDSVDVEIETITVQEERSVEVGN